MLKRFVVAMLLLVLVPLPAWADPNRPAVVTRVDTGSVGVNFGSQQRAQYGQEFYVYRGGYLVGRIRLTQVQETASTALVVETEPDTSIQVGDVVSAFAPRPGTPSAAGPQPPVLATAPPATPAQPLDDGRDFEKLVHERTRTFMFQTGPKNKRVVEVPWFEMANIVTSSPGLYGGPWTVDPWMVGSSAWFYYERTKFSKKMNNNTRAYIEAVYWDESLLSAYTNYYLYKEARTLTPEQQAQTRQSMLVQKGLDKNIVFQVQVTNRGTTPIHLSPFSWHFYLLDGNGNRVKATRYDQALDQDIVIGGQIKGYVYFDRYDAAGHAVLGPGPVKVLVDDFMGEHATMKW